MHNACTLSWLTKAKVLLPPLTHSSPPTAPVPAISERQTTFSSYSPFSSRRQQKKMNISRSSQVPLWLQQVCNVCACMCVCRQHCECWLGSVWKLLQIVLHCVWKTWTWNYTGSHLATCHEYYMHACVYVGRGRGGRDQQVGTGQVRTSSITELGLITEVTPAPPTPWTTPGCAGCKSVLNWRWALLSVNTKTNDLV